jgi:hypothetical protein
MKKYVEKIRKWLGGAAEDHVVRMVAFWWLVYYQGAKGGDLLTVKAGGEDITLQLKHRKCVPLGYESAPIEPEVAERIYGHPLNHVNEGEAVILNVGVDATLECWKKGERDPRWVLPVDIDTLRIVK